MQKLQAAALQGNAAFYAASVFAVSGQRMLPGCKLHPDLMGAAGVQRDLSKAHLSCRFHDAVFQHGFPYTSARAAHREYPAPAAVLEQPVPQGAFDGQCFVRPACNDGPISLDELRHFRLPFGPAILHSVGVLALGDLTAECGRSPGRSGKHHQAGNAGVQPVHHAYKGIRLAPQLPQGCGHALFAGKSGGLVQHHKGGIFVQNVHSLPSAIRALSFRIPAMVLPSRISPLMTIS